MPPSLPRSSLVIGLLGVLSGTGWYSGYRILSPAKVKSGAKPCQCTFERLARATTRPVCDSQCACNCTHTTPSPQDPGITWVPVIAVSSIISCLVILRENCCFARRVPVVTYRGLAKGSRRVISREGYGYGPGAGGC